MICLYRVLLWKILTRDLEIHFTISLQFVSEDIPDQQKIDSIFFKQGITAEINLQWLSHCIIIILIKRLNPYLEIVFHAWVAHSTGSTCLICENIFRPFLLKFYILNGICQKFLMKIYIKYYENAFYWRVYNKLTSIVIVWEILKIKCQLSWEKQFRNCAPGWWNAHWLIFLGEKLRWSIMRFN